MTDHERKLAVLYWQLQKLVHTEPRSRKYLNALTGILSERRIEYDKLNNVGLEVANDSY